MQDRISIRSALTYAAIAFAMLVPGVFFGLPSGTAVVGADLVLQGEAPYRDFWSMYAPGQFWLVAGLQGLFGPSLLVQSLAAVLIRALTTGVFVAILERLGLSRRGRVILGALFVATFWRTAPELDTYTPALFGLLLALDRALAYFVGGGTTRLVAAGLLLGAAAAFKHDVAAYGFCAIGLATCVSYFAVGDRRPSAWICPRRALLVLGAAAAAVIAPVVGVLAWRSGLDAWEDLIAFPATTFRDVRAEPYPGLLPELGRFRDWAANPANLGYARDAVFQLAAWVLGRLPEPVFAIGAIVWFVRRRRLAPADLAAALLFLAGLPFFWTAAHVQQNTHLYSMALLTLCLGAMAWRGLAAGSRSGARTVLVVGLLLLSLGLAVNPLASAYVLVSREAAGTALDVPRARHQRVSREIHEVYTPILQFLQDHLRPGESFYNGVGRHDAIVATNKHFLMLSGRSSCTRYYDLHPGVTDRDGVQLEIIRSLEEHDVRCAVLWHLGWPARTLDAHRDRYRAATPDGGSDRLDRHLAAHFRSIARYGEYEILWRRDVPLPGDRRPR